VAHQRPGATAFEAVLPRNRWHGLKTVAPGAIDATGWPGTAHFKLAEATMAAGEITAIKDMRALEVLRK